jgi:hypothetical protein
MKTFKQFVEQLSLSQAFAKAGKSGGGVGDWEKSSTLNSLRLRTTSDRARPKGNVSGVLTVPLNKATYDGRVESGRNQTNKQYQDNPDYVGPLKGAGQGTNDRMPGTTPSNSPSLSKPSYIKKHHKPNKFAGFT